MKKYYKLRVPIVYWVDVDVERSSSEMTKQEVIDSITDDEVIIPMYQNQLEYDSHNGGFVSELFRKGLRGYSERIETQVEVSDCEYPELDESEIVR